MLHNIVTWPRIHVLLVWKFLNVLFQKRSSSYTGCPELLTPFTSYNTAFRCSQWWHNGYDKRLHTLIWILYISQVQLANFAVVTLGLFLSRWQHYARGNTTPATYPIFLQRMCAWGRLCMLCVGFFIKWNQVAWSISMSILMFWDFSTVELWNCGNMMQIQNNFGYTVWYL
jgi:hypothetical protein